MAFAQEDIVQTKLGAIQGLVLPRFRVFQGVRYAQPPVRWQHSQPVLPWAPSVFNATVEGAGCPQPTCSGNEPPHICPPVMSEDCLFANVWTPRLAQITKPLPTVIFFHGGNFKDGYAGGLSPTGGLLYDGEEFAANTTSIMIVINYRLGALGFGYLGTKNMTGNFGLEDQMVATRWVYDNIAAFGGDPSRITLMGQSAGAMSISCHMSRPQTAGLYTRAIMMSNPFGEPYRGTASALTLGTIFANFSGCAVQVGIRLCSHTGLRDGGSVVVTVVM